MYEVRISDPRLNAYRVVKGEEKHDVEAKANAQLAVWDERWQKRQASDASRREKQEHRSRLLNGAGLARELSCEAKASMEALDSILVEGCHQTPLVWDELKDQSGFVAAKPVRPKEAELPEKPAQDAYPPFFTLIDKLVPSKRAMKIKDSERRYQLALNRWNSDTAELKAKIAASREVHQAMLTKWMEEKEALNRKQITQHAFIDSLALRYSAGDRSAVEYLASEGLNRSTFPESFPQGFELSFEPETRVIVIE